MGVWTLIHWIQLQQHSLKNLWLHLSLGASPKGQEVASVGTEHCRGLFTCDDVMQLLVLVNSCKSKLPVVLRLQKLHGSFPIFWNVIWGGRVKLLQHPVKQNQFSLYCLKLAPSLAVQRCDHGISVIWDVLVSRTLHWIWSCSSLFHWVGNHLKLPHVGKKCGHAHRLVLWNCAHLTYVSNIAAELSS